MNSGESLKPCRTKFCSRRWENASSICSLVNRRLSAESIPDIFSHSSGLKDIWRMASSTALATNGVTALRCWDCSFVFDIALLLTCLCRKMDSFVKSQLITALSYGAPSYGLIPCTQPISIVKITSSDMINILSYNAQASPMRWLDSCHSPTSKEYRFTAKVWAIKASGHLDSHLCEHCNLHTLWSLDMVLILGTNLCGTL